MFFWGFYFFGFLYSVLFFFGRRFKQMLIKVFFGGESGCLLVLNNLYSFIWFQSVWTGLEGRVGGEIFLVFSGNSEGSYFFYQLSQFAISVIAGVGVLSRDYGRVDVFFVGCLGRSVQLLVFFWVLEEGLQEVRGQRVGIYWGICFVFVGGDGRFREGQMFFVGFLESVGLCVGCSMYGFQFFFREFYFIDDKIGG